MQTLLSFTVSAKFSHRFSSVSYHLAVRSINWFFFAGSGGCDPAVHRGQLSDYVLKRNNISAFIRAVWKGRTVLHFWWRFPVIQVMVILIAVSWATGLVSVSWRRFTSHPRGILSSNYLKGSCRLWNSVWECPYRVAEDTSELWVSATPLRFRITMTCMTENPHQQHNTVFPFHIALTKALKLMILISLQCYMMNV